MSDPARPAPARDRDEKPPRTVKSDVLDLVKILVALGVIALVLELISCAPADTPGGADRSRFPVQEHR
jgi:hypothetical protein